MMGKTWLTCGIAAAASLATATGAALPDPVPKPAAAGLDRMLGCRTITAAADRLACFDREAAATGAAVDRHDLVVLDANEVQRSRRAMFGLSDPDQRILSHRIKTPAAAFAPIDTVLRSATPAGYGHYAMVIATGAVWRNVDLLESPPPPGAKMRIEKTALGGYLMKIEHFQSVHAMRVR